MNRRHHRHALLLHLQKEHQSLLNHGHQRLLILHAADIEYIRSGDKARILGRCEYDRFDIGVVGYLVVPERGGLAHYGEGESVDFFGGVVECDDGDARGGYGDVGEVLIFTVGGGDEGCCCCFCRLIDGR